MKRYEKYKPSGIEWLGEIPEHWEVKRVKDLFKINPGFKIKNFDKETQVSFTPMECLRCGQIEKRMVDYGTALSYVPFKNNDILMAKVTPCFENGNIAIADDLEKGIGFGSSEIYVIRSDERYVNRKLAFYLFQSIYFRSIGISSMKGTGGLKRVDPITLNTALYPYISLAEQTAIANYLDVKIAAIDRKIELLTAKADKYKALRRSLINETVCRGLHPNAPLKDSGIEWIGMIPEHWEVKRVKDEINIINGFAFDSESYLDSGLPIIRIGDISNEIDFNEVKFISKENAIQAKYSRIKKYDILMAMTGATIGKNSYFQSDRVAYLNQRVCSFRVQNDSIPDFVKYYIESRFIQDLILLVSGGSAQDNISKYQLENFYIIIPPKNEQVEIANYLDSKTSKIDTILTNINKQITKLTQLRKTLINDVVTGKIKVTE